MKEKIIDISRLRLPPLHGKNLARGAIGLLVLAALYSTFYEIQPEQLGVVTRFGRYVRTTEPGLRMKLPFSEHVRKIPAQRQLRQEFGFRRSPENHEVFVPAVEESTMMTSDLNVAVVQWIVQYRVADPYDYLFRVRNVEATLRDLCEAVVREVVGDRTVTEVLTVGRSDIESTSEAELQRVADEYQMGITVEQIVLQDASPPDPVKPAWDEVTQAQQQRDRRISEAQAEYNKVIPRAIGQASQALLQAEGYAVERVNHSEGDATRFMSLYEAYRLAPAVTRQRMYLETMTKVLPRVGRKFYMEEESNGVIPVFGPEVARNLLRGVRSNPGGVR